MIKVYAETNVCSEIVAIFKEEEYYMAIIDNIKRSVVNRNGFNRLTESVCDKEIKEENIKKGDIIISSNNSIIAIISHGWSIYFLTPLLNFCSKNHEIQVRISE